MKVWLVPIALFPRVHELLESIRLHRVRKESVRYTTRHNARVSWPFTHRERLKKGTSFRVVNDVRDSKFEQDLHEDGVGRCEGRDRPKDAERRSR